MILDGWCTIYSVEYGITIGSNQLLSVLYEGKISDFIAGSFKDSDTRRAGHGSEERIFDQLYLLGLQPTVSFRNSSYERRSR